MRTDTEVRMTGVKTLIQAMGEVDAERFIMLLSKEPFDYTRYQRTMLEGSSLKDIHEMAMAHRKRLTQDNQ